MRRSFVGADGRLVVESGGAKAWEHSFARVPVADGAAAGAKLGRPYADSVWVMRAIKLAVDPLTSVPMVFTQDRRGGDVKLDDPELTAFWQEPAQTRSGVMRTAALIQATGGWLKLDGNAFWVMDDTWLTRSARKSPLIVPRPASMRPVLDADRALVGWRMRDAKGRGHLLIPDQVIHFKSWNPYDEILGLPEWSAAQVAAQSDYAAAVFARNLMLNNGDRGPIISSREGMMGDEQIAQIVSQLRAKAEQARQGKYVAAFLPGNVAVEDPAVQAVDAAFVTQRLENRHEIFIAFGVPASMASLTANYSVGSASDRFRLIEDTSMPLGTQIAEGIEEVSQRFQGTGSTIFMEFDWDEHSTMQQVRRETVGSLEKLVEQGMPMRTAGEYLRMRLPRFPGDEIGRVPFNLVEVEATTPHEPKPPKDDEDEVDDLEKIFEARNAARKRKAHELLETSRAIEDIHQRASDDDRHKLWQRIHRSREPWEKRFESKFRRHLFEARRQTLSNIATAQQLEEKSVKVKASPSDLVFDLQGWLADFVKDMLAISRNALDTAGSEMWSGELGNDDPLTMPAAETIAALKQRENRLKGAGEKVWERVRDSLQEGITAGETMDELAERTRRTFQGIDRQRSRAIAVTETTVAYETGRDLAMQAAGIGWSEWVASGDGRERDSHRQADGQIREMGETFDVGGHELRFPGDPDGPPEEVIHCRCIRIAKGGPDEGDVIGNEDSDEIPY